MRLLIFTCILFVSACGGPPESTEDELRDWVNRGELAAEEKDRGTLLDMISENYVDARGNDRNQIGDLLRLYFFRQQSIALLTNIETIDISGDSAAKIQLTIGMAGTGSSMLGFSADAYKFEFEVTKMDDIWQLIGARWAELGRDLR